MKFGIFNELQCPRPWEEGTEQRVFNEVLEQIALADRLGYDVAWQVEHHFLEEYSHSSAPEIFLGAASQRTSNIRLGHGIMSLPPGINHPFRVAERIGTLDVLSNGRVEFGTGESSSEMELLGFDVERSEKRAMWQEMLPEVLRMMVQQPYTGFDGKFAQLPARNVIPKPVQKPHPPVWMACSQRETITTAAQLGLGALSFSFISAEEAKSWVDEYYAAFEAGTSPIGHEPNPNIAVVTGFMCCDDEQDAIDKGIDGFHFFAYSLSHYLLGGQHRPGATDVWSEFNANRELLGFVRPTAQSKALSAKDEDFEGFAALRGAIGTPDQVRSFVRSYEEAGIDQIIFVTQAGGTKHEDICAALELFAREVMPEFKERDERLEKQKRERLAPTLDRLRAANAVDARPELDYTVVGKPEF